MSIKGQRFLKLILILICFLFYQQIAFSSDDFLNLGTGARAISLGNAYDSIGEDVFTIFYNPAGIVFLDKGEAGISYSSWFQDIHYGSLAVSLPIKDILTIGISGSLLSYGGIEVTERSGESYKMSGSTINPGNQSYILTIGRMLFNNIGIGVNTKYISQDLGEYDDSTFCWDIGLMGKFFNSRFNAGIIYKNIGKGFTFIQEESSLPTDISIGLSSYILQDSYKYHDLLITGNIYEILGEEIKFNIGMEYGFRNLLFFRGGYRINRDIGNLTIGGGILWSIKSIDLKFDYVYVGFGEIGGTHNVSFATSFDFGEKPSEIRKKKQINQQLFDLNYNRGLTSLSEGKYKSAVNHFETALKLQPEDQDVIQKIEFAKNKKQAGQYYRRGLNLLNKKMYKSAGVFFLDALKLDPEDEKIIKNINICQTKAEIKYLFEKAVYYIKKKENGLAVNYSNKILELEPENIRAIQLRSRLIKE